MLFVTLPGRPRAGFAAGGLIVVRRQPRNLIGWLFLTCSLFLVAASDASSYVVLRYRLNEHGLPLGPLALLISLLATPALALLPLALLSFPDGRLPSRGWRFTLWIYLLTSSVQLAAGALVALQAIADRQILVDADGSIVNVHSSTWLINSEHRGIGPYGPAYSNVVA